MQELATTGVLGFWHQADAVGRAAALVLLIMSIATWYLIVTKSWQMWRVRREGERALEAFWQAPELAQAVERMREANPRLDPEQARHLAVHGSYRDEDGTYLWKFDNYVRAASPYLAQFREAQEMWKQITCPTLLFRGTESWASDPEIDGRAPLDAAVRARSAFMRLSW